MFSSLSSIADRNFIVGYLLPVLIAGIACLWLLSDIPAVGAIWAAVFDTAKIEALTLLVLGVWSVALLLQLFSLEIYRVLEGYLPPFNRPARTRRYVERFNKAKANLIVLKAAFDKDPTAEDAWLDAQESFAQDFPPEDWQVMPTRFGNVLRAFECYPAAMYGVDGVPAWLRLEAIASDSFGKFVDAARADVDFFVNGCFLAALVAAVCAARIVIALALALAPQSSGDWTAALAFIAPAILCGVLSRLAYEAATLRAHAWGDLVRSAFDVYLPALAAQMGYTLPATLDKRRDFWDAVNSQFLYNTPIDPAAWAPAKPPGNP